MCRGTAVGNHWPDGFNCLAMFSLVTTAEAGCMQTSHNVCMNALEILAQLSKIASISLWRILVDQGFHRKPNMLNNIEVWTWRKLLHERIPMQDKHCVVTFCLA